MTKEEVAQYLVDKLKIEIETTPFGKITVYLILDNEIISQHSDYVELDR